MERKFLNAIGFCVIGLILTTATVIVFRWALTYLDWARFDVGDLGTWIGGIGTVFTLYMTIRLATAETRRRERNERLIGGLNALSLQYRISTLRSFLDSPENNMGKLPLVLSDSVAQEKLDRWTQSILNYDRWTLEEIVPVIAISPRSAPHLTNALHGLEQFNRRCKEDRYNDDPLRRAEWLYFTLGVTRGDMQLAQEELEISTRGLHRAFSE